VLVYISAFILVGVVTFGVLAFIGWRIEKNEDRQ